MAAGSEFRSNWPTLLFGMAAGAVIVAICSSSGSLTAAEAALQTGAQGTVATVQNTVDGIQVLYLLDNDQRTLCIYQYDPRKGRLKLAAARHIQADKQLLEFNNEEPHVSDIEKLAHSR